MKKTEGNVKNKNALAKNLAATAELFARTGANSACFGFFHEVKKPDLKKLRKF